MDKAFQKMGALDWIYFKDNLLKKPNIDEKHYCSFLTAIEGMVRKSQVYVFGRHMHISVPAIAGHKFNLLAT